MNASLTNAELTGFVQELGFAELPVMPGMNSLIDRWTSFRRLYKHFESEIMKSSAAQYVIDRYELQWDAYASPIERYAWEEITASLIVLYPQYPIGRYFADFAHPKLKIALELDGKQWHDAEKDARRDAELMALGWTIYRVPGSECRRVVDVEKWDECEFPGDDAREELSRWAFSTIAGVIAGIRILHFESLPEFDGLHLLSDVRGYGERYEYQKAKCDWAVASAMAHCVNCRAVWQRR